MQNIYTPRWYQKDAENAIFEYFQKGNKGNPIVAMPTATGKSVVIASFIKTVLQNWQDQKIMMLTHVKELISQNAEKLVSIWPTAPIGIHSAGLKERDFLQPIIFGGVQSVAPSIKKHLASETGLPPNMQHFGWRDLLIVDECHLISDKESSQYQFVINSLMAINPNLKVIGFSATPWRMKMGHITSNGIFTDVCYDITDLQSFNRLISEGFLAPLIAKPTNIELNTKGVKVTAGEFNQKELESETGKSDFLLPCINEMLNLGYDRKCWLVFTTGIENCEDTANLLQSKGLEIYPVHSKLAANVNDERLAAYKAGEILGIVSGRKLTTGFDNPQIDFIADLNATLSPSNHVQKYGRGLRPAPGKINCLVADFAGNVKRLGPINEPVLPRRAGGKGSGDAPVRICPSCGVYNHATARQCFVCGQEFTFESKISESAYEGEIIKTSAPVIQMLDVQKVIYNLHEKRNKQGLLVSPPMIKVSYFAGFQTFNEFVMLEHGGFASKRSIQWWQQRHHENAPPTTYEALQKVAQLRTPSRIKVHINKLPYPEILSVEF